MGEFAKFSLPSIASLLGIADNGPPQQQEQATPRKAVSFTTQPDLVLKLRRSTSSISSMSQHGCVPNSASCHFTARSTTNLRLNSEWESVPSAESRGGSIPLTHSQYGLPNLYVMSPAPQNMNSYYPTIVGKTHISDGVDRQQPRFNVGLTLLHARSASKLIILQFTSPSTNPLQHHHYIAPSSAYRFRQDYICPKCGKAFSRPSSLKIHSHSHTGEKPFYCPVRGCGRKFSVWSNMKRHERGCHGGGINRERHY